MTPYVMDTDRRVGRLELHCALARHPRSEGYRRATCGSAERPVSRSCPLLSVVHRSAADPTRTDWSSLVADGSGASVLRGQGPISRPGTARPMQAMRGREGYVTVIRRFKLCSTTLGDAEGS